MTLTYLLILSIKRMNSELKFEILICKRHVLSFLLIYNVYRLNGISISIVEK